MAIFPSCGFKVMLPRGGAVAGERLEGSVVLTTQEEIPRAERLQVAFITSAHAGYGSGKNRSVKRATVFHAPLELELKGSLPAGVHTHPFAVDLPPWLPPAYEGRDCGIGHSIAVRLDVDWALDPKTTFSPVVVPLRGRLQSTPATIRSHPSFHETVIVELALQSTAVVLGGFIEGSVALRGGQAARFDALELTLAGNATIVMGRRDRRRGHKHAFRIEAERLREGRNVPFRLPVDASFPPTFRNGFIDHDVALEVSLDVPWSVDPSFAIPLEVLPRGSSVEGAGPPAVVGNERSRLLAAAMARATGLREGAHPVLVEGVIGPATLRLIDSPRSSRLGVDVEIDFPAVDLGLELRPEGLFDLGKSPLLPEALASRYVLRRAPVGGAPPVADDTIARFVSAVTAGVTHGAAVRLSDHHLGLSFVLEDDAEVTLVGLARLAAQKADDIGRALADPEVGLPFPHPISREQAAWRSMAAAHSAWLVPSRPALHGIVLAARVLGGDERQLTADLRAVWSEQRPTGISWDVDLRAMPLPEKVRDAFERHVTTDDSLPPVAAPLVPYFSSMEVHGADTVTLGASGWHEDPREWLGGLDAFFAWVLEARGERRTDSPYR